MTVELSAVHAVGEAGSSFICAAITCFLQVVLGVSRASIERGHGSLSGFGPIPCAALWIVWQLATYSFLHASISHLLLNMLTLWMFGSQEEQDWGSRKFLENFISSA